MIVSKLKKKLKQGKRKVWRFVARQPKLKFVYGWYYKHCKVEENVILFESFHGSTVSDSPLYILKELLKTEDASKYKIYYSTNPNDYKVHKKFLEANNINAELVDVQSYKYVKVLATAKYLINNSSFPAYFIRKEEQVYLQTWHGTPLKTLGKQMRLGIESMYNVQHNFLQANYLMHPNEFTKDSIMRDYNLENLYTGKVALSGYPRNSIFLNKERASEVRKELGLEDKTVYAYMPTWRGTSNHAVSTNAYGEEVKGMMDYLDSTLKDNQILYVNFHPILKNSIQLDNYKHIKNFPDTVDKYEFLNSVDALITDYSSVFFDFSVTRKPIILFMYDYEQYMQDRGMYFDIAELPFVKLYNIEDLSEYLVTEKILEHSYDNDEYCEKFLKYDSEDASRKMLDLVLYGKTEGLEIEDYSKNKEIPREVIYPTNISNTGAEFETLKHMAKENTIVLFEKRWFTKKISSILYDNYNDYFDYAIITRTTPRTFLEEGLCKLGVKSVIDELFVREQKRTFPNLKVPSEYNRKLYYLEQGCYIATNKKAVLEADIQVADNKLQCKVQIDNDMKLCRFVLLNVKSHVVWTRELTEKEKSTHSIYEDFSECKELLPTSSDQKRYRIACEVYHESTKEYALYFLSNAELVKKINQEVSEYDKSKSYLAPVMLGCVGENTKESVVLPYYRKGDRTLTIFFCDREKIMDEYAKVKLSSIKSRKTGPIVSMLLQKQDGMEIKDVVLRYRSADTYDIPVKYEIIDKGNHWLVKADIDFTQCNLREIYWDFRIIVEKYDMLYAMKVKMPNNHMKYRFYLSNVEYDAGNNHIVFPYYTKGSFLAFCYRASSEYDAYNTKLKEMAAILVYLIAGRILKRKRIWLVYEKFCSMAQDNGYYFFKYCMENLPESEKKHIYYVIDKKAVDYEKIKQYDKHVIQFMSFKHCLYNLVAKIYIGSDSKSHLYAWRCKTSLIRSRMGRTPIYFLQHGVTALKQVHPLFGKKGSSPMTYFTATSQFEQDIIVDCLGYARGKAPIVGFTRWDVLEDTSVDTDRIILLMPTWRSWLEEVSDEDFLASDYYKNYSSLLQSARFNDMLEKYHTRLIFYIHPKFAGYLKNFSDTGNHVELITFGQEPLNEIMKRCHMLITDYSSVCWDVYYLGKPVVFYQFDYEKYRDVHGSYVDMEHDLFGRRATNEADLLNELEACMASDFAELEKDKEDRPKYFEYIDNDNSKRTYEFLISKKY